jgi:hypothetical protein
MKLYNHALAPNPRRVPSLPQKKRSNLRWKKLISWLQAGARPEARIALAVSM